MSGAPSAAGLAAWGGGAFSRPDALRDAEGCRLLTGFSAGVELRGEDCIAIEGLPSELHEEDTVGAIVFLLPLFEIVCGKVRNIFSSMVKSHTIVLLSLTNFRGPLDIQSLC